MGLFSRRRTSENEAAPAAEGTEFTEAVPAAGDADALPGSDAAETPDPARGPWDADDAPAAPQGRVDLGSLLIPAVDGMQLRLDVPQGGGHAGAVILALGGSTLELRAFAAPRTEGIWDDLRRDIAEELSRAGARYTVEKGSHGPELLAHVPVTTPDGAKAEVAVRFLGVDGPRWFLRGVLQGPAATDAFSAQRLREVFDDVVVVRGTHACPPRELLTLHAPGQAAPEAEDLPGLESLEPGPTIAEIN